MTFILSLSCCFDLQNESKDSGAPPSAVQVEEVVMVNDEEKNQLEAPIDSDFENSRSIDA